MQQKTAGNRSSDKLTRLDLIRAPGPRGNTAADSLFESNRACLEGEGGFVTARVTPEAKDVAAPSMA